MAIEFNAKSLLNSCTSKIEAVIDISEDPILISKLEKILTNWPSLSIQEDGLYALYKNFYSISNSLKNESYYRNRNINKEDSKVYKDLALEFELIYRTVNNDHKSFLKQEKKEPEKRERFPNLEEDIEKPMQLLDKK